MPTIHDVQQEKKRLGPTGPMQVAYRRLARVPADVAQTGGLVLSEPRFSDDAWRWTCDLYFAGPMWKPWTLKDVAFFQGKGHNTPPRFTDVVECLLSDALGWLMCRLRTGPANLATAPTASRPGISIWPASTRAPTWPPSCGIMNRCSTRRRIWMLNPTAATTNGPRWPRTNAKPAPSSRRQTGCGGWVCPV